MALLGILIYFRPIYKIHICNSPQKKWKCLNGTKNRKNFFFFLVCRKYICYCWKVKPNSCVWSTTKYFPFPLDKAWDIQTSQYFFLYSDVPKSLFLSFSKHQRWMFFLFSPCLHRLTISVTLQYDLVFYIFLFLRSKCVNIYCHPVSIS